MANQYGQLTDAEYDALMKDARHARGATFLEHVTLLVAALRRLFATR